jgi:hypothetical protein
MDRKGFQKQRVMTRWPCKAILQVPIVIIVGPQLQCDKIGGPLLRTAGQDNRLIRPGQAGCASGTVLPRNLSLRLCLCVLTVSFPQ